MNQNVFENKSIPKSVATLALPSMLSMLVTIFYNMADTFFVGQTGDANQVAAVSLTTPVFLLLMAVGNIFGVGGSSCISRLLGEQKAERVKKVSSFCFYGGVATGVIMMIVFISCMPVILPLIGASPSTIGYARDYLFYIACGSVFVVVSTAFSNLVRGEGAAKVSMTGMMLGTVVNIVLDPIMILTLDMGVAGAAIATIIGNACSCLYYLRYLRTKGTVLSISPKDFTLREKVPAGVLAIGIPASINNVLMSTANIILNNFLASYGDTQVAAMGVAMKANMLVVMLQLGLATGVQPLIGYHFGAGNHVWLKKIMKFSMACNVAIGSVLTAIYFVFTESIVRIFLDDPEVISSGVHMLRALQVSGPFIGIMFVFSFSFQAMGKAIPSLILSLSRQGLVFLPVLVIANRLVGLTGIVYAQPVADIASLFIALAMFLVINRNMKKDSEFQEERLSQEKTLYSAE